MAMKKLFDKLKKWKSYAIYVTYYALCVGIVLEGCEAQVPDLDKASRTGDEYVIALKVAMNDWRRSTVEKAESLQNLATPVLDNFDVGLFQTFFYVPERKRRKKEIHI